MTQPVCPHCGAQRPAVDLSALSVREAAVVKFLLSGMRLAQIAAQLEITSHTVRNHLKQVNRKLGVHSQVELLALLNGHIAPRAGRKSKARRNGGES